MLQSVANSDGPEDDPQGGGAGTESLYRLLAEQVVDYAIFALDPTGHVLNWNRGARRLKGYAAGEIIGKHFSIFYPPEALAGGKPEWELRTAAREGRVEDEGWRVRKDGSRFWANVVITALRDDRGELVGFAKVTRDLTARRQAEERARQLAAAQAARAEALSRQAELQALNEQLQAQALELESQTEEAQSLAEELEQSNQSLQEALVETEEAREAAGNAERFARGILEAISDPFVVQDADWRFRYVNAAAAQILGVAAPGDAQAMFGRVLWDVFPDLRGSAFEVEMRRAMETRQSVTFEAFRPETGHWAQMFCYPMPDGGLATQWKDITLRKQAEEAAHYLARASALLGASMDYEATLSELARLVVPQLADWSAVDIVSSDGGLQRLAVAHVDPAKVAFAERLAELYPTDADSKRGVPKVIRTGEPELYPDIPDALLVAATADAEHLRMIRELGLRSAMVVPLAARGRVLGALTLVSAESRRRYGEAELTLATELGRRAGIAVDNARLLAEARAAAERTTRLQAVTAGLARVLDPDAVASTVVREGLAALGAASGIYCAVSDDGTTLEIRHAVGVAESATAAFHTFPVDAPYPIAECVRAGQPIYLESKAEVRARYPAIAEASARATTAAWIALPISAGGRIAGALAFGFGESRQFPPEDRAFARALAQQAGQAVERARLYRAEQAARAEAETANRAKADFLATMSHELRTPLNAIAGYAELLAIGVHGPVNEAQGEAIERIRRSQRHLQSLIEDILGFARIEAGRVTIELRDVALSDVIAELEPLVAPQLQGKALRFDFANFDASLMARADGEKVRQILLNLLSNAIKFTAPGGSIAVVGRADGPMIEVAVKDTGIGIPPERLESVFEPFVQLGRTLSTLREGTGLGLAISRDLARAMGGDLVAESEVGRGSTFRLLLPKADGEARESRGARAG